MGKNRLKIALAYNTSFGDYSDQTADKDILFSAEAVKMALLNLGHEVIETPINSSKDIINTNWKEFDKVFNLVESIDGLSSKEMLFPAFLDLINVKYTGSPSNAIANTCNKILTKQILIANNIGTPNYLTINLDLDISLFKLRDLNFPIIIKPANEDASLGITKDSVIYQKDIFHILKQVRYIHSEFNQPALIEEFIQGREFNVSLLELNGELTVLPVAELIFKKTKACIPNICSYDGKWKEGSDEYQLSMPSFEFDLSVKALLL